METDLDAIAEGEVNWQDMLSDFYGTDADDGIHDKVTNRLGDIDGKAVSTIQLGTHPTTGESVEAPMANSDHMFKMEINSFNSR